ncbi:MAG: WD40 repeat domain-containing protein [Aggregatilineales bacterium]
MRQRLWIFGIVVIGLLGLIAVFPALGQPNAQQLDPTQQQQTINAIVFPRLTLTAQSILDITVTALNQASMTSDVLQTASALAQTATLTPSASATITSTPTSTLTPEYTPTLDATSQFQTIIAVANGLLTQTPQMETEVAGTANFQGTVNSILVQTLGYTLTPTPTPSATHTPIITPQGQQDGNALDATSQFQTIIAVANGLLTQTPQVETEVAGTANFQGTVNSILIQTLGYTFTPTPTASATRTLTPTSTPISTNTPGGTLNPTRQYQTVAAAVQAFVTETAQAQTQIAGTANFQATINHVLIQTLGYTSTPTVTPTLNPLQAQQTIRAVVNQSLTETPRAQVIGSATAAVYATLNAMLQNNLTATATTIRATLVHGLAPINSTTAPNVVELAELKGQTDSIQGVAFSADGSLIASASLDGSVWLWDTRTGKPQRIFNGLTGRLSVAFSPDGTRLIAATADGTLRVWDLHTNAELSALKGHLKAVNSVVFSPDGRLIASGSDDRTVRLWDAQSGGTVAVLSDEHSPIAAVAFSPGGTRVAAVGRDTLLTVWEVSTGIPLFSVRSQQALSSLVFSPNGTSIAIAGYAGQIQIRNVKDGSVSALFNGQGSAITSLAISPDGLTLASGSRAGAIWLWDLKTGAKLAALSGHPGGVYALVFSPDGTRLVSSGKDNLVRVWGVPTS